MSFKAGESYQPAVSGALIRLWPLMYWHMRVTDPSSGCNNDSHISRRDFSMQMCRRVLCDRSVLNGLWSHDVLSWQRHCSQLLHHKSRSTILSTCSSEATLVKLPHSGYTSHHGYLSRFPADSSLIKLSLTRGFT